VVARSGVRFGAGRVPHGRRLRSGTGDGLGQGDGYSYQPSRSAFRRGILADVVLVVGIAVWEKTVFGGYLIKNLAEGLYSKIIGAWWATVMAILIPSLLFGWLHSSEANATMLSTVNTMIFGPYLGPRMR
jgi:membrane protease YdiL (CAAX protease family)